MKVKLDEGLSYRLKLTLLELGHDVDTVLDEGLKSEDDAIIAGMAFQNNRMLFTLDRGLGDLRHYAPGEHPGIIVFRLKSAGPGYVSHFVEDFVRTHDLEKMSGCLVIAEAGRVRIRGRTDTDESSR